MTYNVFTVFKEGVLEALGHEDVASKDAAEGRPLNLVDGVGEVVLALVLLDRQLQLADCLLDLNFEDHVLGLFLGKAIVHLDHLVALFIAHLINSINSLLEVIY